MQLQISANLGNLIAKEKGNGQSKLINKFLAIKPVVHEVSEVNSGFFMPSESVKKDRRDIQWLLNHYSKVTGKKFIVVSQEYAAKTETEAEKPAGIWCVLAQTGLPVTKLEMTDNQKEMFGNTLDLYVPEEATEEEEEIPEDKDMPE